MHSKKHIATALVLIAIAATASAATYHVSPDGDRTHDGSSAENAFSLSEAQTYANSNPDEEITFLLANGEYGEFIEFTNERTSWATWKANPGHIPIFTTIELGRWDGPFDKYLRFEGINVNNPATDNSSFVLYLNVVNHVEFINCNLTGRGKAVYPSRHDEYAVYLRKTNYTKFEGCTFTGTQPAWDEDEQWLIRSEGPNYNVIIKDSIFTYSNSAIHARGTNWLIQNNQIYDMTEDGLVADFPYDFVIENNHIYNIIMPPGSEAHTDTIQFQNEGNNVTVRGNKLYNSSGQIVIINLPGGYAPFTNFTFENNLMYGALGTAATFYIDGIDGLTLINNTIDGFTLIRTRVYNLTMYNNIMFLVDDEGDALPTGNEEYNIINKWHVHVDPDFEQGDHTTELNDITEFYNLFVDYSGGDYSPLMSSLACNGMLTGHFLATGSYIGALPCEDKTCLGGLDSECDNSNICTNDECVGGVCDYTFNTKPCNDNKECTDSDVCSQGSCAGSFVLDGTPCTADGLFCTGTETCQSGLCTSSGTSCVDDGVDCTLCDEVTQQCNVPDNSFCDDGNPCTNNTCNPVSGCVTENLTGTSCDSDGIFCTEDLCNNGICQAGTPDDSICLIGFPDCTNAACDVSLGCINYLPVGCRIPNVPSGYVSYWKFDGDTKDLTGVNNGTFYGNVENYVERRAGDYALELDGDNDYVNYGSDASLELTDTLTIIAWVNVANPGNAQEEIFAKSDTSVYTQWEFFVVNGNGKLAFGANKGGIWDNSTSGDETSETPLTANKWHHVAVTYDSSTGALFYLDGVPDGDNPTTGLLNQLDSEDVTLGVRTASNPQFHFTGKIDEVMIYNRALNETEIQQIYCNQGGTANFCEQTTECVDTPALLNHISQWKQGQTTMQTLMEKIAQWKTRTGCS